MGNSTRTVVGNPLSSSSSQVGATRALGIIIEPEPVARAGDPGDGAAGNQRQDSTPADRPARLAEVIEDTPAPQPAGEVPAALPAAVQQDDADTASAGAAGGHSQEALEQTSQGVKAALDEAGRGAAAFTCKLVEFVHANARSTLDLARDYASVRSVPDAFDAQAAYVKRQFDLLSAQAEEFQRMASELTSKTPQPFKA